MTDKKITILFIVALVFSILAYNLWQTDWAQEHWEHIFYHLMAEFYTLTWVGIRMLVTGRDKWLIAVANIGMWLMIGNSIDEMMNRATVFNLLEYIFGALVVVYYTGKALGWEDRLIIWIKNKRIKNNGNGTNTTQ